MNKPEPKVEMLVTRNHNTNCLFIHVGTPDAREWVMNEAVAFGELYERNAATLHLWVSPLYDIDEVFAYMATGYNSDDNAQKVE